jgi:hypothetical protein
MFLFSHPFGQVCSAQSETIVKSTNFSKPAAYCDSCTIDKTGKAKCIERTKYF